MPKGYVVKIIKYVLSLFTIIAFEVGIIYFTMQGIDKEVATAGYRDFLLGIASYIGTILAIFFTLYVIPIQNIVGKYSQEFLKRVIINNNYIVSFILLAASLFYVLYFAMVGASKSIASAGYLITFFSTLILGNLVIVTARILDIRRLVRSYTNDVIKCLQFDIRWSQKENLKKFKTVPQIDQELPQTLSKFKVSLEVTEELREKMLPLISVISSSIRNEQLEIFREGMRAVERITLKYIEERLDYGTYTDDFLTYIDEQLIIIKNLSVESSNQKLLPEVITVAKNICMKALEAKPIRSSRGENNLLIGFTNLLENICLSKELFKETSYAPSLVCSSLGDIGVKAVSNNFPQEALHSCVNRLAKISRTMIALSGTFPDYVSNVANHGIMKILNHSLLTLDEMKVDRSYLVESALEEVNNIYSKFTDGSSNHYRTSTVLSPFFGPMATNGIAQIFGRALAIKYKDDDKHDFVLRMLEKFLQGLNQTVTFKAIPENKVNGLDDIIEHLYQLGILLIQYQYTIDSEYLKKEAKKILEERIFLILINIIEGSFSSSKNWRINMELYPKTFGLMGIIIFETFKNKRIESFDMFEKVFEKLIIFASSIEDSEEIAVQRDKDKLLSYIRLAGAWMYREKPRSKLTKQVIDLLDVFDEKVNYSTFAHFPTHNEPYPTSVGSFGGWVTPRPLSAFYPYYWGELDKYLTDTKMKQAFEKAIKRKKKQ